MNWRVSRPLVVHTATLRLIARSKSALATAGPRMDANGVERSSSITSSTQPTVQSTERATAANGIGTLAAPSSATSSTQSRFV